MAQDEMTARAMLVQTQYTDMLMRKAHVMGVAVGLALKGGVMTDKVALVVLVDQKLPPEALSADDLVPEELDGVECDVQEIGFIAAQ
jgi:hypothetical protein